MRPQTAYLYKLYPCIPRLLPVIFSMMHIEITGKSLGTNRKSLIHILNIYMYLAEVFLTAYQALVTNARMKDGETVLIHAVC